MKTITKRFALLAVLFALFAALTVTAYADDPASDLDLSLVFSSEAQLTVYVDDQWSADLSPAATVSETRRP